MESAGGVLVAAPAGRAVDLVRASQWIKRRNAPPKALLFQCRLLAMTPWLAGAARPQQQHHQQQRSPRAPELHRRPDGDASLSPKSIGRDSPINKALRIPINRLPIQIDRIYALINAAEIFGTHNTVCARRDSKCQAILLPLARASTRLMMEWYGMPDCSDNPISQVRLDE